MSWSAAQYGKFEAERTRPVRDLLAGIQIASAATAIDLGCGPGNSTEALLAKFPDTIVTGLDDSPDMIAAARRRLPANRFELGEIGEWARGDAASFDIILSNAALQWLPDHAALFPALIGRLAPGGALAVQMPDNLGEPAHLLMNAIAADGPWAEKCRGAASARTKLPDAAWYFDRLRNVAARIDIWRTIYHHPLAGIEAVVEWFKGSGLRPYLACLEADEQSAFLARYRAAIQAAYPPLSDGMVLLPFPRLFIVAQR